MTWAIGQMNDWYLQSDGQESGPFSRDELVFLAREGRLSPDDQLRRGASGQWRPAKSVLENLRRPVQKHKRPPVVEPSPASNDIPQQQAPDTPVASPPPLPSRSSGLFSPLTVAVAAGIGLTLLLLIGLLWFGSGSDTMVAGAPSLNLEQPGDDKMPEPESPGSDNTGVGESSGTVEQPGDDKTPESESPGSDTPETKTPDQPESGSEKADPTPEPDSRPEAIQSLKGHDAQKLLAQAVGKVVLGWRFVDEDGERKETPDPMFRPLAEEEGVKLIAKGEKNRVGFFVNSEGDKRYYEWVLAGGGSCFFVTSDGFALTNKHVVEDFVNIKRARKKMEEIKDFWDYNELEPLMWVIVDGRPHEATVRFTSDQFDLAAIQVDLQNCPFFRLSTLEEPVLLTEVMAMGFPGAVTASANAEDADDIRSRENNSTNLRSSPVCDQKITLTRGEVTSVFNRLKVGQLIQHGANINPGNSGGPLWDSESRAIIGINTWEAVGNGLFFALQMKQLREEIDEHVPGVDWYSPLNPE